MTGPLKDSASLVGLIMLAAGCTAQHTTNQISPLQPTALPPIEFKLIGIVVPSDAKPKIAVLSDCSGPPVYGKEGDLLAGRYQILKVGEESIELSDANGSPQTIRLTGSSCA
jgi:hypothetical protein